MATHSSILAWRILWTEEPGGLQRPWCCKELDKTVRLNNNKWNQSQCQDGQWACVLCLPAQSLSRVQLCVTPWTEATRLLCPWDSPGNTGEDRHALPQGIILGPETEPSSPVSSASQADSLSLNHQGIPVSVGMHHIWSYLYHITTSGRRSYHLHSAVDKATSLAVQWVRLKFQCRRLGFRPSLGNKDPTCCMVWPKKKKKIKPWFSEIKYCVIWQLPGN